MIGAMGRLLAAMSGALLAMACATPKPPAVHNDECGAAARGTGHSLEVYLSAAHGADKPKRPLCPGQALGANDAVFIHVELESEAHVRLVYIAPDGHAGELMHQEEAELTRSALFRAPRGLLSHAQGEAQLFVVASKRALADSDAALQLMLDTIRETGTLVDRDGSLHPPAAINAPPAEIMQLELSDDLFADFDDNGMAMLAFSLRADF